VLCHGTGRGRRAPSAQELIELSINTLTRRRGSYGFDAPPLLVLPPLLIACGIVQGILSDQPWPFLGAALVAACAANGLYAIRRGKFIVWARLLDGLGLSGDEQVLDVGCGRGAVLLLAAERLTRGRAIGIDIWKTTDQSGNASQVTRRNAILEGVNDRVELHTADMTALPFPDDSFDLVLSSLAVHNTKTRARQNAAVDEAARVLRPGGQLMIADIRATARYQARLDALGMADVTRRRLGWRMWFSGPFVPTHLVTATKPHRPPVAPRRPPYVAQGA
jgi:arsenite methyltransferase